MYWLYNIPPWSIQDKDKKICFVGEVINVCFYDGTEDIPAKIIKIIHKKRLWNSYIYALVRYNNNSKEYHRVWSHQIKKIIR